jgi:non-heme chloroperoxidase
LAEGDCLDALFHLPTPKF